MGKFYESKLYALCTWMYELMKINVLFVLCSLPVFTLGPSFSAMYSALRNLEVDGTASPKVFLHTFHKQFRRASLFTLLFVAIMLLILGDIYIANHYFPGALIPLFVWIPLIFGIVCLITSSMLFPILPLFHAGHVHTIKIAFVFTMRYLLKSILCSVVNLLPVLLLLMVPNLILQFVPIWLLIGFSFLAYGNTKLLLPVYSEIDQLLDEVSAE